ncbi:MAG: T9SS type A sorting domain-containing protein [Bacteroidaceae bacterium]|nr:T9SS type A sorting domain-containing protein [Bacteroidaceae bacterium]
MKKILLIVSLITLATTAAAQHLVVEKTGVDNEIVTLDNLKQITFDGITVNIEQNDGTKNSTTMGNINRIYFSDLSSIADIQQQDDNLVEYLSADEIAINADAGSAVSIYSLTGASLLTKRINAQGSAISIANLPKGIYIVKANERTTKIIKR